MYKFVLPLVIDRRRAILLDLIDDREEVDPAAQVLDSYVVEFPAIANELLKISTLQPLQSLTPDRDDVPLSELSFSLVDVDPAQRRLRLELRHPGKVVGSPSTLVDITRGLALKLHAEPGVSTLELKREAGHRGPRRESFGLEVCYVADDGAKFIGFLTIHVAEPSQILRAGLDFGSEASQIRFARGDQSEAMPFDLLEAIRDLYFPDRVAERETFVQDEADKRHFYRSVFFANKIYGGSPDDLDLVTPRDQAEEEGGEFLQTHHKIPNLKLLGLEEDLGADIIFEGEDGQKNSLLALRENIYDSLVERMVISFLERCDEVRGRCLRFTILVPNIYDLGRVAQTRSLVSRIVGSAECMRGASGAGGFEIDVISESDASFLGYAAMGNVDFKTDSYTIVIDCGKGTTDFSVILTNADASMRSVYRNGFAGAGNLISFAFYETLVGFVESLAEACRESNSDRHKSIRRFIDEQLKSEASSFRYQAYEHVERWKKAYGTGVTQSPDDVRAQWMGVKEGAYTFENVFDEGTQSLVATRLKNLLAKVQTVHDWDGHIRRATELIADTTRKRLEWVIRKMNRKHSFGGILFTGRAFLFAPLASQMKVVLGSMDGLSGGGLLDTGGVNLKEICMQGVFHNRFVTHSDVVCTPMEVTEKDRDRAVRRSDISDSSMLKRFVNWVNYLLGLEDAHLLAESSNSFPIVQRRLLHARFRMGETVFQTRGGSVDAAEARIVISRSGLHIVARDQAGRKLLLELRPAPGRSNPEMKPVIWKSLFPVFYNPELIGN